MHPSTEKALHPFTASKKSKSGFPQIMPVYDNGGDVSTKAQQDANAQLIAGASRDIAPPPAAPAIPQYTGGSAQRKPQPRIDMVDRGVDVRQPSYMPGSGPNAQAPAMPKIELDMSKAPVFDEGGDVDVNDGNHTTAIVEDGERVLTPEQNAQFKQEHPEEAAAHAVPTQTARIQAPHPAQEPQAAESTHTELIPRGTPQEQTAIKVDKQKAMGSGNLIDLGKAIINQQHLEPSVSDSTQTQVAPNKIVIPQESHQDTAGGALIPGAPTSETPSQRRDFGGMEHKAKLAQYDQQIQAARDSGDETAADKLALAKIEYQKSTPWGTEGNHPGILGKIGHIAAGVGNIAGNIVAPSTMALIPGTALNRELREKQQFGRIAIDTENDAREAQANAKEGATPSWKEVTGGLLNPKTGQYEQAFYNEKNPTQQVLAGQLPPKASAEKTTPATEAQLSDYKQRIANSGLTGKALDVYGNAPVGSTAAELDKRFDEATKLRGMDQKDAETKVMNQARTDAAAEHKREHEETRNDRLAKATYTYTDKAGVTHVTTGDKLDEVPEDAQLLPVKDLSALVSEGRSMNAVQDSLNELHKDLHDHPEVFDNTAARTIVQTTTEQMNRVAATMLIAGTGGSVPLPSGLGDMINTGLQNRTLDAKTAKAVKEYIADYKAMKDKAMVIQMAMQNGKMGRGGQQAFESIVNQIPGGSTPDSATALRQMGALQRTATGLMGKYPDQYADYTKSKPYAQHSADSSAGYQVGQQVVQGGKTYTVTAVDKNGNITGTK